MYIGLGFSEKMIHVLRLNFPPEVSVALFGTVPGDILGTDDPPGFPARKVHGHIMLGPGALIGSWTGIVVIRVATARRVFASQITATVSNTPTKLKIMKVLIQVRGKFVTNPWCLVKKWRDSN